MVKTYQQRDKEREAKIQELEEKVNTYDQGSKLDILAELAIVVARNKELVAEEKRLPIVKTSTCHTVVSLGYELWKVIQDFSKQKEEWKREKEAMIIEHTHALERKDIKLGRLAVRI